MTKPNDRHVPVLFQEAIDFLNVRAGGTYVDCTLGLAGHAEVVIRKLGPQGHFIGFDRDWEAMELAKSRLAEVTSELGSQAPRITLLNEPFSSIAEHVKAASVDGLLADFGVSSLQFDQAERGFSFQADGGERASACGSHLRVRRGKEVAENRQSHCSRAAGYNYGAVSPDCNSSRPDDETRAHSSGDQDISSSSYLCESRIGRDQSVV